ncbi:MAG: magnesium transporter CorA family protein [Eubacterium sp.]|nr:magnesium transporter CorA family protein [Eubacterium sp.]
MHNYYISQDGLIREINEYTDNCWIKLTNPTEKECLDVSRQFNLELADVRAALDEDEASRVVTEEGYTLVLVDIPVREAVNVAFSYTTIPIGVFITPTCVITVCARESLVLKDIIYSRRKIYSTKRRKRLCCQILYRNCMVYQALLRDIDKKREEVEKKINKDLQDSDLINLHYLETNLVYFATALRANQTVLERIRRYGILKEYEEDEELLEDTIVENTQAIETTKIYQDIIRSTSELFSTVINNRLNDVMKLLTSITIVMTLPTIIAGIWGMNVNLPFGRSPFGFGIVLLITMLICIITVAILKKKKML